MIRDIDNGYEELIEAFDSDVRIEVGVQGSEASQVRGETTMVNIAAYHEFGRGNNPERSFIASTVDKKEKQIKKKLDKLGERIINGTGSPSQDAEAVGLWIASLMQGTIRGRIAPKIEDSTKKQRRHGGDIPLLDTAQLLNSITSESEVKKRGQ